MNISKAHGRLSAQLMTIFLAFVGPFGHTQTGQAASSLNRCEALGRPVPRVLDLETVGEKSYSRLSQKFIDANWSAYIHKKDMADFGNDFATNFVRENIKEIEENHALNVKWAEQDLAGQKDGLATFNENSASIVAYIHMIKKQLDERKAFSNMQMMTLAYVLVVSRERGAFERLKELAVKTDSAVNDRYKGFNVERVIEQIREREKSLKYFWANTYKFRFDDDLNDYAMTDDHIPNVVHTTFRIRRYFDYSLPLPSQYPTGAPAFYRTFHLPLTPVYLPRDYELVDGVSLSSPLDNFLHDINHFMAGGGNMEKPFQIFDLDHVDLENIRQRITRWNDPQLLRHLYFAFYFIRFEQPSWYLAERSPKMIAFNLQDNFNRAVKRERGSLLLQRYGQYNYKTLTTAEEKAFLTDLAEIAYVISVYSLEKKCGTGLNCFPLLEKEARIHGQNLQAIQRY